VNGLPKTVTRQRRGCDVNPGPSAPESSVQHANRSVIAKFHYTDPTGPGSPTKSAHVVGYELYPTTCADFVGDPGPVGSV